MHQKTPESARRIPWLNPPCFVKNHNFPIIFPWFSHGFSKISPFSHHFPRVFLAFPGEIHQNPPKSTRLGDCGSPLRFRDRYRLPADLLNAEPQRRVPWLRLPRPSAGGWSRDGRWSRAMVSCFWEVLWIFFFGMVYGTGWSISIG